MRLYFEEIKKDGAISSWYLAKKFDFTKEVVNRDLENARNKGHLDFKTVSGFLLHFNFTITKKGLKYIKKPTRSERTARKNRRKELNAA